MITVIDYGIGNTGAVMNMLDYLGIETCLASDAQGIRAAEKLILPGVGAFDKAMATLRQRDLVEPLNETVLRRRTPILGICLGMQLLARGSEEGRESGLGWVPAEVKRIVPPGDSGLKVPHIGWSVVDIPRPSALFDPSGIPERFYFVHSYHMVCDDASMVAASVDYGTPMCCAVVNQHIFGVQFHPEKSHRFGMRMLRRFSDIPCPA